MTNKIKISVGLSSDDVKVLNATGNAGDVLKKHKVNYNAVLLVREGKILFTEEGRELELGAGDCTTITAEVYHEVNCLADAKFFLVLPNQAKMKFSE
ncbi:MAG: quercetin dioxygenase-like cupin family protein [Saprospiraceae bacterium]|jgi:quercetin dioxygenase-like cupin family protein